MLKNERLNNLYLRVGARADTFLSFGSRSLDLLRSDNFQGFVESLQIVTKDRGRQSLIFNAAQETIWHWFLGKREKKEKARGICCKSRREGVSTLIEAICFADVMHRPNRYAYVASHERESSDYVFRMSKLFYEHLGPEWIKKRPLKSDTKGQIIFGNLHNSMFTSATANKKGLGSSQLIHDLHLSEPAKYPDPPAKDAITSILQCVPDHWDTLIFWESTAFGMHNIFHSWWEAAKAGQNDYDPIFLSWKDFPEYWFYFRDKDKPEAIPSGATVIETCPQFSPEEREYQKTWSKYFVKAGGKTITDQQMAWFSDKLRNTCHGDWGEVNQEYPIHDTVAFKFSGKAWFDLVALSAMRELVRPPLRRGYLKWVSDHDPLVVFEDDDNGWLEVWQEPRPDGYYVAGADIAEGCGGDFANAPILSVDTEIPQMVAKLRGNRIIAADAGNYLARVCAWYNRAFLGVERNNQGLTTLNILETGAGVPQMMGGYPNLYYQKVLDQKTREETKKLGWLTTRPAKELMLGHAQMVIRNQAVEIYSLDTFLELEGFTFDPERDQWIPTYKNQRTQMCHDDEVISLAIALQMVQHARERSSLPRAKDGGW